MSKQADEITDIDYAGDGKLHLSDADMALFVEQVLIMATKVKDAAGLRVYLRFDPVAAQNMAFIMLSRLTMDGGKGQPGNYELVLGGIE